MSVGTAILLLVLALHLLGAIAVPPLTALVLARRPGTRLGRASTQVRIGRIVLRALLVAALVAVLFAGVPVPVPVLILVTLVNLTVRENFPFSNFPMYYSFAPRTYYLKVTDGSDGPIALKSDFKVSADYLRRLFNSEAKSLAKRQRCSLKQLPLADLEVAGRTALDFLAQQGRDRERALRHGRIKLYMVAIFAHGGEIVQEPRLIGERRL